MPILTVGDLKIGKIAYVPPSAILADLTGRLVIASTAQIYLDPTPLAFVTIRKQDHLVIVDRGTLGHSRFASSRLPNPQKGRVTYLPIELADYYVGYTAAELEEGKIAYIIPWAIFPNIFGGGSIDATITCTNRPVGTSDQKLKKQNGKILVERDILKRRLIDLLDGSSSGCSPSSLRIKIVKKI